jgi:hypothetical protein
MSELEARMKMPKRMTLEEKVLWYLPSGMSATDDSLKRFLGCSGEDYEKLTVRMEDGKLIERGWYGALRVWRRVVSEQCEVISGKAEEFLPVTSGPKTKIPK